MLSPLVEPLEPPAEPPWFGELPKADLTVPATAPAAAATACVAVFTVSWTTVVARDTKPWGSGGVEEGVLRTGLGAGLRAALFLTAPRRLARFIDRDAFFDDFLDVFFAAVRVAFFLIVDDFFAVFFADFFDAFLEDFFDDFFDDFFELFLVLPALLAAIPAPCENPGRAPSCNQQM